MGQAYGMMGSVGRTNMPRRDGSHWPFTLCMVVCLLLTLSCARRSAKGTTPPSTPPPTSKPTPEPEASNPPEPRPPPQPSNSDRPPPSLGRPSPAITRAINAPPRGPNAAAPPDRAPENPLGYADPIEGCFVGQVYLLPERTRVLPSEYKGLKKGPRLHACEWNVPPQPFDKALRGTTDRIEWFAVRYEGAFHVAEGGTYVFRVSSDDGSKLTIDGKVIVNNDGLHAPRSERGEVELAPGDHTLLLEYFQGPRYHVSLQVWVTPPGGDEGLLSVRD